MAKINRKLAVAGATAIALAGVTAGMAFISLNNVTGRTPFAPEAAPAEVVKAQVVLDVTNLNSIAEAIRSSPQPVNVPVSATTDIPTTINRTEILPDLWLPELCPAGSWTLREPRLNEGFDGKLTPGAAREVGTFELTFNFLGEDKNQNSCLDPNGYEAIFGVGGGFAFGKKAGLAADFSSICFFDQSGGGTPNDYPDAGTFAADTQVFRIRNIGSEELSWTFDGSQSGSLEPGESTFVARHRVDSGITSRLVVPGLSNNDKSANNARCDAPAVVFAS